ncbi:MAG: 2'-5' RNA ligase family protein [Propioniciclava sp.]|uniref:2'-5' RNA ligase family protein n=1 Tax=Propioniciclava sp. TaxID=2038686 RepID=UPI0039E6E3F3
MSGHAVLLVGVPELEGWVRARTAEQDATYVSRDPRFAHAHITVLAPFPPDGFAQAAAVASAVEPFDYALTCVRSFPNGVIYLPPSPEDGFRALTDAARRAVPEVVPYWGWFDPVPHLTLDRIGWGVTEQGTRASVAGLLPASCRAEELLLTWWEPDACRVLARYRLGRRAAAAALG